MTFYDGKALSDMKTDFPHTDLLEMFFEMNETRPDSWYKSYRVRDFIIEILGKGVENQIDLLRYLKKDLKNGSFLPEEILMDIYAYFNMDYPKKIDDAN